MGSFRTDRETAAPSMTVGSVDLGSNSFHMMIARVRDQHLHVVDRLREPVCLANGLDENDRLSAESLARAVGCLERFGQRLREIDPAHVRVVGTNSLRQARNGRQVCELFEKSLGHSVDIISGHEEARLIYLGVCGSDYSDFRRLVVDIGGGSTEIIVGEGAEVVRAESLFMGCVRTTRAHFADGELSRERFRAAEIEARLELRSSGNPLRKSGCEGCVGASGTVAATEQVLIQMGWSDLGITLSGLKQMRKAMIRAGSIENLNFEGIRSDRARVLPGGVAILIALFKSLGIETMTATSGALREGVLYDLLGRIRHEDVREGSVERMAKRYHVDREQGARVEHSALALLTQAGDSWIDPESSWFDAETSRKALVWAARLHEVGLEVAYAGYHKHGAYLVANSDLAGFSAGDQRLLALLIRWHRRKLSDEFLQDLPLSSANSVKRLCAILRLAVLLNRGRVALTTPVMTATTNWDRIALDFPEGWFESHPLTSADLRRERGFVKGAGIRLDFGDVPESAWKTLN